MHKISLLDCTLRDGGYINDWEFGHNNLVSIFERLVNSGTDIIEVGFIDERRPYDVNRSIYPDTESIGRTYGKVEKRPSMVVGMIDYGTCDIDYVQQCSESFLDGIRVIFKKGKMHEAMDYVAQVKALGYKVFAQLVSITAYADEDLDEITKLINEVKPYAVSIVDTYSLLDDKSLMHYYDYLDENMDPDIVLGFHAHNNLQLAYSNVRTFLSKETEREILVDATLFGMGKNAGNAPLELVAKHLNDNYGAHYDTNAMLEAIEESIKQFFTKNPWGYKTFFYMYESNKCHPSYVEYFQRKGNLSATDLSRLLSQIEPEDKKLLYDPELAESLYLKFVRDDEAEYKKLATLLNGRNVMVVGPGKNIKLQLNKVNKVIEKTSPVIITINHIPDFIDTDYVFLTKSNRSLEATDSLAEKNIGIIATSNLEPKNGAFAVRVNREPLLEKKESIEDNSFLMLLKILKHAGIKEVYCAGFDGYSDKEDNYAYPGMEYDFVKREAAHLNSHIREVLEKEYSDMTINFVTYSKYDVLVDINSGAF